ncbi:hypothetical protein TRIUR3_13634 [Triticum urartu]|uniref:Uncharacterized protein n=1 Tax=Triticum urartu TaxID=4572 RepID=M7ZGA6_TRIUA|nr:hypothetical protein TRIUR3_13634 [Triticum urartu]
MDELHPLCHPLLILSFPQLLKKLQPAREKVASTLGGVGTSQGKSYDHFNRRTTRFFCWVLSFVLEMVVHAYGDERGAAVATIAVVCSNGPVRELQIVNGREFGTQRRSCRNPGGCVASGGKLVVLPWLATELQ